MPAPQRTPARERRIADITQEDRRVGVIGTVVDAGDSRLVVDDGEGKIEVSFEEAPAAVPGSIVRVMGKVMAIEGAFELQGEVCQDFSGVDIGLWRDVSSLWEGSLKDL